MSSQNGEAGWKWLIILRDCFKLRNTYRCLDVSGDGGGKLAPMMGVSEDGGGKLVLVTFLPFVTKHSFGSWFEGTGHDKEKHGSGNVSQLWQQEHESCMLNSGWIRTQR